MSKLVILLHLTLVFSEEMVSNNHHYLDRSVSDNETSKGFSVEANEDLTITNKVVTDMDQNELKPKVNLKEAIKPLEAVDVKCLMSVDNYCSEDMRLVKGVLIQSLKNNCGNCSAEFKEKAGRIAVAMMAHDPVAWKLFLTRYYEMDTVQKNLA